MEVAGLVIGVAGVFSVCTEILDKVQSFRGSQTLSEQLYIRFKAEKVKLYRWAEAVGFQGGVLADDHHYRLDHLGVKAIVHEILVTIIELFRASEESLEEIRDAKPVSRTNSSGTPGSSWQVSGNAQSKLSKKVKIKWAFGGEKAFTGQVENFEALAGKLYALIPPDVAHIKSSMTTKQLDDAVQNSQLFNDVHQSIQAILSSHRKSQLRQRYKTIEQAVKPPQVIDILEERLCEKLDGTCDWIFSLAAFSGWLKEDPQMVTTKVLWLHGSAGTGKTILSARIVESIKGEPGVQLFYFFCTPHVQAGGPLSDIIRRWIFEAFKLDPIELQSMIKELSEEMDPLQDTRIWDLFDGMVQRLSRCVFVIDGIDEYDQSKISRENFLLKLQASLARTRSRLLVVSRDEVDLRTALVREDETPGLSFACHRITTSDTKLDIDLYSGNMVKQRLAKKNEAFQTELAESLSARADGMFLWIKLSGQHLRSTMPRAQIVKTISEVPAGLSSSFARSWNSILARRGYERARAMRIFTWCLFGFRSLSVRQMTEALVVNVQSDIGFNEDDLPDEIDREYINHEMIDLCSSLVEITSDSVITKPYKQSVRLVHVSVKEFLLEAMPVVLKSEFKFSAKQHLELAKVCLCYLNARAGFDIRDEADNPTFKIYAVDNWYLHHKESGMYDAEFTTLVDRFLVNGGENCDGWLRCIDQQILRSTLFSRSNLISPEKDLISWGSAVYVAALLNLSQNLSLLLQRGVETEGIQGPWGSPLQAACAYGCKEAFDILLQHGSKIDVELTQWNGLDLAVKYGHLDLVHRILGSSARFHCDPKRPSASLHLAVSSGNIQICRALLDAGFDVNQRAWGIQGSVFAMACNCGKGGSELLDLLYDRGADCLFMDEEHPIYAAAHEGQLEIVEWFIAHGWNYSVQDDEASDAFRSAIEGGQLECAMVLYPLIDDINRTGEDGLTYLHSAARGGYTACALWLINNGADVNTTTSYPIVTTPLSYAVMRRSLQLAWVLVRKTVEPFRPLENMNTILHLASDNGDADMVNLLLDFLCSQSEDKQPCSEDETGQAQIRELIDKRNTWGRTALHRASELGSIGVVEILLANGADAAASDTYGETSLHLAAQRGHLDVVQAILRFSADFNKVDDHQRTAIWYAAQLGHLEVTRLLLKYGADPWIEGEARHAFPSYHGGDALTASIPEKHSGVINLLLDQIVDIGNYRVQKMPFLHWVVCRGSMDIVKILLGSESSTGNYRPIKDPCTDRSIARDTPTSRDSDVSANHLEIRSSGKPTNADTLDIALSLLDHEGRTMLHCAVLNGHIRMAQYLALLGFSLQAVDVRGRTMLDYACMSGSTEMVQWLLDMSPSWDELCQKHLTRNCWSALHWACRRGDFALVKMLVDHGYQATLVRTQDPNVNWTPLDIARYYSNFELFDGIDEEWMPLLSSGLVMKNPLMEGSIIPFTANNLKSRTEKRFRVCEGCGRFSGITNVRYHCNQCPNFFFYCMMCYLDVDISHDREHDWTPIDEGE